MNANSNLNLNEEMELLLETVKMHLDDRNFEGLGELIEKTHPVDIAETLMELEDDDKITLFLQLPWDFASDVLEEIDPETFSDMIKVLKDDQKAYILDMMSQDDIVDKLGELSDKRSREIIAYLDIEDAADVRELMFYDEDTAGGIMTKDYITLKKDYTIYHSIETLRETAPESETIYYVYVTDNDEKLVGVISLRELIVSKPNALVSDVMNENVISVDVYDDQEEVAKIVSKYSLLAIPVTDNDRNMLGIITVDDIIDVIEEEATEDILKFAGSSDLEDFDEEGFFKRIIMSVRSRLPWLIITVFGGLVSASIVKNSQGILDLNTSLAMFMPLLAGMGGNVGTQSSTLTVRSIAMDNIYGKDVFRTILQEMLVGMMVGIVCSIMVATASLVLNGEAIIGLIVGIGMFANIVTAATLGTIVPIVFKKIGVDPAVASAPFISTTVDITGLSIYFAFAAFLFKVWL